MKTETEIKEIILKYFRTERGHYYPQFNSDSEAWTDFVKELMFTRFSLIEMRTETDLAEELMTMIDLERDNGNIVGGGFSPALLLSKIIKRIEKK